MMNEIAVPRFLEFDLSLKYSLQTAISSLPSKSVKSASYLLTLNFNSAATV
jgi:hypothetical protein